MKGTITISLEDYEKLVEAKKEAEGVISASKLSVKELQVFLSYICTRENLAPLVEEFNRQSVTSKIVLDSGRARIMLKDDKN